MNERTKEWWAAKAKLEGNSEVGAGGEELHEIAIKALGEKE